MTTSLQPASFRGIPFAVTRTDEQFGRRIALHTYPGRDTPWAEDLGRAPEVFRISGFILDNDQVYGGGSIDDQRQEMKTAAEAAGPGTLIHPTLGSVSVVCRSFSMSDGLTASLVSEVTFDFVESGQQQFPSSSQSTGDATGAAADDATASIADDFVTTLDGLASNFSAIVNLPAIASEFVGQFTALAYDATSLLGLTALLPGNFGRYSGGGNTGFISINASPYAADVTVGDLITDAADQRAAIAGASGALTDAISTYGISTSASDLPPCVASLVAALVEACADPADALRLLNKLIEFAPQGASAISVEGSALVDLTRRAAVIALAQESAVYQPSSYDDAFSTMLSVCAAIDDEITLVGDAGLDDTYSALRALRVAVVTDLRRRGALLAPIRIFTVGAPIPALVLAQRFYGDASRADDLVRQAGGDNPLFMPTSFKALAA